MTTWGVNFTLCGINIQTVEAHHPSHIKDKHGNFLTGMTHGYIISVDSHKIYHMGDTSIFGDLKNR